MTADPLDLEGLKAEHEQDALDWRITMDAPVSEMARDFKRAHAREAALLAEVVSLRSAQEAIREQERALSTDIINELSVEVERLRGLLAASSVGQPTEIMAALIARRKHQGEIIEAAHKLYKRQAKPGDDPEIMDLWSLAVVDPEPLTAKDIERTRELFPELFTEAAAKSRTTQPAEKWTPKVTLTENEIGESRTTVSAPPDTWLIARKRDTEPWEVTTFDRYDEAALFFDRAQQQWSTVYFCRVAHCEGKPLDVSPIVSEFGRRLAECEGRLRAQAPAVSPGPKCPECGTPESEMRVTPAVSTLLKKLEKSMRCNAKEKRMLAEYQERIAENHAPTALRGAAVDAERWANELQAVRAVLQGASTAKESVRAAVGAAPEKKENE